MHKGYVMTLDELKLYDGKNGAKAYIAYKGVVYDVTQSPLWKNGEHQGEHSAGVDLTLVLANAPHGEEVFNRYPAVGTLEINKSVITAAMPPQNLKTKLRQLYKEFHPHPMTVHFPIALHVFAAGADVIFLATKGEVYESLVFYSFFVATVMGLVAMMPGLLSWWINYNLSTHKAFMIKIILSIVTLLLGIVAISIYLGHENIAYDSSYLGITYHAIVLFTGLSVMVLGYYGGKIAWGELNENK